MSNDYQVSHIYPRLFYAFAYVILGFIFWLSKVPERIPMLGRFECVQLYFNSHVWWHVLVVACEYNLYWACYDVNVAHEFGADPTNLLLNTPKHL